MVDLAARLDRAAARVQSVLIDTCRIRYDQAGVADDELDEDTGLLVAPDSDDTLLYDGPCAVQVLPRVTRDASLDASQTPYPERDLHYQLLLPTTAPTIPAGAAVLITKAGRDPQLAGQPFRTAVDAPVSSLAVLRAIPLEVGRT